jgi:hypothetical protein
VGRAFTTLGLRKLPGLPACIAVPLMSLTDLLFIPLAMTFLRS